MGFVSFIYVILAFVYYSKKCFNSETNYNIGIMAVKILTRKSIACMVMLLIWLTLLVQESNARPPWLRPNRDVFTESAACHTDDELLDLCQRCAKLTKSKLAYPACCSTDLQARKWCSDYVYFGRGEFDFYS